MRNMVEVLEAEGVQQEVGRCICMSNNSPALYKMQHVYATQQLNYALIHAQVCMQTHSHLSV